MSGGAPGRGGAAGGGATSGQAGSGAGTAGGGTLNGGSAGLGNGGTGGIPAAGLGGTAGTAGADEPGGSGGEQGDDEGLGVRFIGFISESVGADLPASTEFLTRFPDCPAETSSQAAPLPRFNECFARGIVRLMNESLTELTADAPHFRFQSLEIIADDRLATFHSDPNYSGYELQHLLGSKYRVGNTMTFLMPSAALGPVGGLTWTQDERLNPDFGMAAVAVPSAGGTMVFLHEFGHGVGFPHAGNAAYGERYEYPGCGGVTIDPPACSCETQNFMETAGSFTATSGCEPCTDVPDTTFDTEYFGPKFAEIAACWVTRRLEPSDIGFVDGDCFGLVDSSIATCKEMEGAGVTCACPSGQIFVVDDCTDAGQDARNAATSEACDRITCPPPPERPGVVCQALAGAPTIWCTCEDPAQGFSVGSDCSGLTLANIERLCPPL